MKAKLRTGLKMLVLLLLLFGFLHLPADQINRAAPSPQAGEQTLEALLKADGSLDLTTGFSGSRDAAGWRVSVAEDGAPQFEPVPQSTASTTSDGTWGTLGLGLPGYVRAVAVEGGEVYAGEGFSQTSVWIISPIGMARPGMISAAGSTTRCGPLPWWDRTST